MNSNIPNVALVSCGEEVYPKQWLFSVIDEIKTGLKHCDLNIVKNCEIMSEDDADNAVEELSGGNYDLIILNIVSWHITPYIMKVLNNYRHIPLLIWSIGGKRDAAGKLHSPAALAAVTALLPVLKQMKFKYKVVIENPDEPHRFQEVESFAKVARAYQKIRNSRIGLIGYADMGLFTCAYDKTAIFDKFGVEIEDYFSYEIGQQMESASQADIDEIIAEIKKEVVFDNVVNEKALERSARLYYALKGKANSRHLDAISIKCVHGVTKYMGVNPCLAQSMLANKTLSVICECDAHGLLTNVILSALTSQTSSFMEHYEVVGDKLLVGTCGFIPFDFIEKPIKFKSTNLSDFFTGFGNVSKVKTGVMTAARVYKDGDDYKMFITKAEAESPMKWIELGWEEPTPDFPSLLLKPGMDINEYIENVPGQHVILVYGDYVDQLNDLCKLFNIKNNL